MPRSRYAQVSLDATPYYHCVSRCVRRAFLCGHDQYSGRSFEHRRQWIEDKLLELAQVFAIDLCAYAVMSNHYHVVLNVDQSAATQWTGDEVIERWHRLFSGHLLSQRYQRGERLSKTELKVLDQLVEQWRERLMDISWFMRCSNEAIARQANDEDDCTGRFWEGRYKCQALLDDAALAACMAYVDLNPIRAGITKTPEQSAHTSVRKRLNKASTASNVNHPNQQPGNLLAFVGNPRKNQPKGLPFRLTDYLELIDWSGRMIQPNKRSAIPEHLPTILQRLNIDPQHWQYMSLHFESRFKGLVGAASKLKQVCRQLGYRRTPGMHACKSCFPS